MGRVEAADGRTLPSRLFEFDRVFAIVKFLLLTFIFALTLELPVMGWSDFVKFELVLEL